MAEMKTKKTKASVSAFIASIADAKRRKECRAVMAMMRKATGKSPKMWGATIVGYGDYHYRYESGREGDWFLTGFSPRKQALTLYLMDGFAGRGPLLKKLGKHKTGKACLYIKSLDEVDLDVLRELIERSVKAKAKSG